LFSLIPTATLNLSLNSHCYHRGDEEASMLMNRELSARARHAASLVLLALCVGGAVTAYHFAARPTIMMAVAVLLGGSLLGGATYLLVEPVMRRSRTLERKSDARLASAIAGLKAGIALFDDKDRLVVANPTYRQIHEIIADILVPGVPFETILRENVRRSRFDLGADEAEGYIARRLDQHRNPGPVMERRLNDGRWEQVREQRLSDGGLLLVILDITEEKAREDALVQAKTSAEEANRAKTDFMSTMSHELRTPLNAIIGFTDMMLTGVFGPIGSAKYLEYTEDVHRSGRLLLEMINEILDLSKIEAGRYELYPEDLDLAPIVADCVGVLSVIAQQRDVELTSAVSGRMSVKVDDRAIRHILLNLLSNAVKFTSAGGSVTLSARAASDGTIAIAVRDTGIGIAAADLDRIFEPFRQADTAISRTQEGTGLGLPIAKRLVELSGGRLALESRLGLGTTFTVWLPAAQAGSLAREIA
jgi:two-component system cell cycle sensor histidine kinase PleC